MSSAGMQFVQKTEKDNWQTPPRVIDPIERFVGIDLDPCAGEDTQHGAVNFRPPETCGIQSSWDVTGNGDATAFVNPPYSKTNDDTSMKRLFLQKGISEYLAGNVERVFFLLPDSTDVKSWWQPYIATYCQSSWFPSGRVNYIDPDKGEQVNGVSFGSSLSVAGEIPLEFQQWMHEHGDFVNRPFVGDGDE